MELQGASRGEEIFITTIAIVFLCAGGLVAAGYLFEPPLFGSIGDFFLACGILGPCLPCLLFAYRMIAAQLHSVTRNY